ncbi:MAG: ABC transporter permease [Bryobacteraceae bacterium]|nr:ABC transporter permease [Bryobacteraceae bacterium]
MTNVIENAGRSVRTALAGAGDMVVFGLRALVSAVRPPFELVETLRQIQLLGWRSLSLIATSGLAVGVVMSMHTRSSLERFGAESMIPTVLGIAMIRETGPLVTGLLSSGRLGAGIGAELGGMRVTEQIDALESLAVDSFKYLVVTRVVACMVALPLLTIFFNVSAIVGGWAAETTVSGMTFGYYYRNAFSNIGFSDLIPSTLKTVVFGFLISSISGYLGYNASGGAQGVGQASTRSVVLSAISLIVANVVMVKFILFLFPS